MIYRLNCWCLYSNQSSAETSNFSVVKKHLILVAGLLLSEHFLCKSKSSRDGPHLGIIQIHDERMNNENVVDQNILIGGEMCEFSMGIMLMKIWNANDSQAHKFEVNYHFIDLWKKLI